MKHGSLFSGIGGFDLASEWMGWENVFHCEINEFGKRILKYYWPEAISYDDITKTDFTIHRGKIDVLSGGFPCQPFSVAGKREGTNDARHLWPEMLRAIREVQPKWVVGENVRGLTNWNGGMVFDQVQLDLENEGYEVIPFLLPACAVNAPHRRDRIWFMAYSRHDTKRTSGNSFGNETKESAVIYSKGQKGDSATIFNNRFCDIQRDITDTECIGQQEQGQPEQSICKKAYRDWKASWTYNDGRWPLESPICSRDDGLSFGLVGVTVSKHRKESLKGYGNAVVPQIVMQIFKSIEQYESI